VSSRGVNMDAVAIPWRTLTFATGLHRHCVRSQ
jgi:hypothetical protein